ncbi:peroxisome assembly factor 1 [Thecamonas trahens ATCC 50062]|uniref:RING-type E3 ubiquitin transferase (cysteine targeting) n=1 Tax=Thecamonas trahens ATCC 50062 TaxID=461836 RepID=A0A0L0D806_THETB|nr:peroxisome assembly factor 1 [Thecamonas trahens ATCC 50062]KNC48340.1 peroxisome assembly factor 1 [Thecamonas trahens ATCC 50062]|eukprot:XP_013758465.1 peroxisome assembly factor 1 [Thecamonas trahens ATCC 50062]
MDEALVENVVYSRAGAADSYVFNSSLTNVYRPRIVDALRYVTDSPQAWLESHKAMVSAALALLLHHASLLSHDATFGGLLYNMVYRVSSPSGELIPPSMPRKLLHVAASTAGLWAWIRLDSCADSLPMLDVSADDLRGSPWQAGAAVLTAARRTGTRRTLGGAILRTVLWLVRAASLVNALVFLRSGAYVSLLDRVLGMQLVRSAPGRARFVALHFMDRTLGWIALSNALAALLPLINIERVKTALDYAASSAVRAATSVLVGPAADTGAKHVPTGCIVCGVNAASFAFRLEPCHHSGCYYCLAAHRARDPGAFSCPRCASGVSGIERVP